MTTQTPAGWYPDPYGEPRLRWWDGAQWTDATHAQEQGQGQQPQPSSGPQPGPQPQPQSAPDWSATPANPTLQYGRPSYSQPPYGQATQGQPTFTQPQGPTTQGPSTQGPPTQGPFMQGPPTQWSGAPLPGPGYGPPPKQGNPLPWVFGGLAALVVVALIVVAGIFFINRNTTTVAGPGTEETQEPPSVEPPSSEPPTAQPSVPSTGELPQPQNGRVTDPQSGISYLVPDGWKAPAYNEINGPTSVHVWTSGVQATSQDNYEKDSDWVGNVYAGPLSEAVPYADASGLGDTAQALFMDFSARYYEPAHESKIIENKAIKIGQNQGWVLQFQLDFTKVSEEKGYKWKKENGAIVLMDRGAGQRPTLLYVSVPDNLGTDVVAKVLGSLKPA